MPAQLLENECQDAIQLHAGATRTFLITPKDKRKRREVASEALPLARRSTHGLGAQYPFRARVRRHVAAATNDPTDSDRRVAKTHRPQDYSREDRPHEVMLLDSRLERRVGLATEAHLLGIPRSSSLEFLFQLIEEAPVAGLGY